MKYLLFASLLFLTHPAVAQSKIVHGYTCDAVLHSTVGGQESSDRQTISVAVLSTEKNEPLSILAGELHKQPVELKVTGHTSKDDSTIIRAGARGVTLPRVGGKWDIWTTFTVRQNSPSTFYAQGHSLDGRFEITGICEHEN